MTHDAETDRRDMLTVLKEALVGADRVVVETRNALGKMDAHYLHAPEVLAALEQTTAIIKDAPVTHDAETVERVYLIQKGGSFYRPNSRGYTTSALTAGRYTYDEAVSASFPNGPDGPRDGMRYIHQDDVVCENLAYHRAALSALPPQQVSVQEAANLNRAPAGDKP